MGDCVAASWILYLQIEARRGWEAMSATSNSIHIPLDRAYLCADCSAIGNNPTACPACASANIYSVQRLLDRTAEIEVK